MPSFRGGGGRGGFRFRSGGSSSSTNGSSVPPASYVGPAWQPVSTRGLYGAFEDFVNWVGDFQRRKFGVGKEQGLMRA